MGPLFNLFVLGHFYILCLILLFQVLSIFRLAAYFMKPLVIDFVERYGIPRPELHYALDKLLPALFRRTGDTAVRIREVAKNQVLNMAQWPQVRILPYFSFHQMMTF